MGAGTRIAVFFVWPLLTVVSAAGAQEQAPTPSTPGTSLRFEVRDAGNDELLPARIHLSDGTDTLVAPEGLPAFKNHFSTPGTASITLRPGTYTYDIERGPEYTRASGTLQIPERPDTGAILVIEQLERIANLAAEGWWSGDLHIHRPPEDIETIVRAEDLHIAPVITWWNQKNLWQDRALPDPVLVRFDGNRYYQLMAGEDERNGGAFMFFNLNTPIDITQAHRDYPCQTHYLPEARQRGAHIDLEKPYWWDGPIGIGLGLVDTIGICNNHMWRHGMLDNEAWGRPRQHETDPPAHANGHWVQEIYYHVLNAGLRIPPSAGSASGVIPNPVGYNRVYVQLDGALDYKAWWEGLRAGRSFVTNGPLLRVKANGEWPGHVFKGEGGAPLSISITGKLDSNDPVRSIQVIKNGKVALEIPPTQWADASKPISIAFDKSGWFLVRAIADVDHTFRFASTAPWYVEIGGQPRTIHPESVQFFLDWIDERNANLGLDSTERNDVKAIHDKARAFWAALLPRNIDQNE